MIPITARAGWRNVDIGNDKFRDPYFIFVVSFSRRRSDSDSGNDGCWEKVIDLWMKMNNSPSWP